MSNRTLPIVFPTMNPRIYNKIAPIGGASQKILMPATREVVTDTVSGGVCVRRTPQQGRRTGVNGSTPGYIGHAVSVEHALSPFLILIVGPFSPNGINMSLQVANKWQSTSPALVGNTQKLDAVVDRKFPDDLDSASIFIKLIGHKTLQHLER